MLVILAITATPLKTIQNQLPMTPKTKENHTFLANGIITAEIITGACS